MCTIRDPPCTGLKRHNLQAVWGAGELEQTLTCTHNEWRPLYAVEVPRPAGSAGSEDTTAIQCRQFVLSGGVTTDMVTNTLISTLLQLVQCL